MYFLFIVKSYIWCINIQYTVSQNKHDGLTGSAKNRICGCFRRVSLSSIQI